MGRYTRTDYGGCSVNIWGFAILTVGLVALAGPFPGIITAVLILILSGMILSKAFYPGEVNLLGSIFGSSSTQTTSGVTN